MTTPPSADHRDSPATDVVVIGAGFSGLYATKRLLDEGFAVRSFDAGDDVGGVWNWNRYPGAQTDSPHHTYRFTFAEDLLAEWEYSRKFPPQSEVLGYLRSIADTHGLRDHYTFGARVVGLEFDGDQGCWTVTTDRGDLVQTTYVVTAVGLVSEPVRPVIAGLEDFTGQVLATSSWPSEAPDLAGKRVAIIGTGSSGIQLTPQVAAVAGALTVFQRTPNYIVPTGNRPIDDADREEMRERYDDVRRRVRNHPAAFPFEATTGRVALQTAEDERAEVFEQMWQRGGFSLLYESFDDLGTDLEANELVCAFIRGKIAEIVHDPETARVLTPTYPYGAKRPPTGDGYYEAFNLPHVDVVDLRSDPITTATPTGLRTASGDHDFDVIVFATGFDASTGSFTRMEVRGRDDVSLAEHWAKGPRTLYGIGISGFPNLFMVAGPQSPFSNLPPGAELAGDWIADVIVSARAGDARFVEPRREAEDAWVDEVNSIAAQAPTLAAGESVNSWFTGANVEGKARAVNVFFGGAHTYADRLDAEAAADYPGFQRTASVAELA